MSKQTIVIASAAELSIVKNQLSITTHVPDATNSLRPIEDIRTIIIDHHSVHISVPLINRLADNNIAVIFCNENHMPNTMLMDLESNSMQTKTFRAQLEAPLPLKNRYGNKLWKPR